MVERRGVLVKKPRGRRSFQNLGLHENMLDGPSNNKIEGGGAGLN
jgi:hypothetical protein